MTLEPLRNTGSVSEEDFQRLFGSRLGGDDFCRALQVLGILGPMHSFSVANVLHLALQKDNLREVLKALEEWCELFPHAPDPVVAYADTREFFDEVYGKFFMTEDEGFDTVAMGGVTLKVIRRGPQIWLPPGCHRT